MQYKQKYKATSADSEAEVTGHDRRAKDASRAASHVAVQEAASLSRSYNLHQYRIQ